MLDAEDVALVVWLLCDEILLNANALNLYTSSPLRLLLKTAPTYVYETSRVTVLLCLDATLSGGGLEAARQVLHSHSWKPARDVGSDFQTGVAALRYRMRVNQAICMRSK